MASLPLFKSGQILSLKPFIVNDKKQEIVDDEHEIRVVILGHKSNPDYEVYLVGIPKEAKRGTIELCGSNGTVTIGKSKVWVFLLGCKLTDGFGTYLIVEVPEHSKINIEQGLKVEPTALNKTPINPRQYTFQPKITQDEVIESREIHTVEDQSYLDLTIFPNPNFHFYVATKNVARSNRKKR